MPKISEMLKALFTHRSDKQVVIDAAERFWDKNIGKHREPFVHWSSPEPIRKALNSLVSGTAELNPPGWFIEKYGPFTTVAELGCGDGVLTRYLATRYPAISSLVAYDFSQASLDMARISCATNDICSFQKINLNTEPLPPVAFDAVFATGCIHHIEALDFCFASIARSLKQGGLLWLNDYVGPNRFQWSDTQMRLANTLLTLVPEKWRLKDQVIRCDAAQLEAMDPSEAVASSGIEDALFAYFEVIEVSKSGGTLLAPIFGSGCLSRSMAESEDGLLMLRQLFDVEQRLIAEGVIKSQQNMYVARPRPPHISLTRGQKHTQEGRNSDYRRGCQMPIEDWLALNSMDLNTHPELRQYVSPFPPAELMRVTSGLTSEQDFASHGVAMYRALSEASYKPLPEFTSILDFGCGVGRLARMFKGYPYKLAGCDIDKRLVEWMQQAMPNMEAKLSRPYPPAPFETNEFEAIISISIFTHLTEESQDEFLQELHRICKPDGRIFLTIQGEKALQRAAQESTIKNMLSVDENLFRQAQASFAAGKHSFIYQDGHLTTVSMDKKKTSSVGKAIDEPFTYGITFIPEVYIQRHWTKWFDIEKHFPGAIHNFQDIVVLIPRK